MTRVRFKNWDCVIQKCEYGNGRPALQLVDASDGEPIATATVNLPDLPAGPNQVFIKDYSENEGMLKALTEAGVVKPTGETVRSGFVEVPVCELQPPFRERTLADILAEKSTARAPESHEQDRGRGR
jgi:hypothetical protein